MQRLRDKAERAGRDSGRELDRDQRAGGSDRDQRGAALRAHAASELQIPAGGLLALDRLEQRFEVALAEGARAVPLDHLEEERRPVLRRLREDLEQVAVLVAVRMMSSVWIATCWTPGPAL